jgi:hypothetical protein
LPSSFSFLADQLERGIMWDFAIGKELWQNNKTTKFAHQGENTKLEKIARAEN